VKLAVTGGCGFIGSNLVEELVKRGLIFINMMDEAPNPWIIARNGTVYKLHNYFNSIIAGLPGVFKGYQVSEPSELSKVLGINEWGSWRAPSAQVLKSTNVTYLACGKKLMDNAMLFNPVFIKVSKGGWVYLGDGRNLREEEIAHDIVMIITHMLWNGIPMTYARGGMFFSKGGQIRELGTVSLSLSDGLKGVKYLRLILIAYFRLSVLHYCLDNFYDEVS
jgi:hypothetical protein